MIKVVHHSQCSKSNAVLEYLDENEVAFEVINILEEPLSVLELKTLLKKLNLIVEKIIRKNETLYKERYASQKFSEDEWIQILHENPTLIQRPILIKGSIAMIARPTERAKYFIEN